MLSSKSRGTSTDAFRNTGRPQNSVSSLLSMRTCRMYFVSFGAIDRRNHLRELQL